jgi:hypothetical protein
MDIHQNARLAVARRIEFVHMIIDQRLMQSRSRTIFLRPFKSRSSPCASMLEDL